MVKFRDELRSFGAIVGIDLATYHTGVAVYDVQRGVFSELLPINVKNTDEEREYSLFVRLRGVLSQIACKYGNTMVVQERLPNQCGKFTTVATLQALSSSHAAMKIAIKMADNVELYDSDGIHTTSVKALFKTPECPKPQKSDIRKKLVELYRLDDTLLTDDISDAVAVVHTLLKRRWNSDLDDQIKREKKEIKALKAAHAIAAHQAEIQRLIDLKI